MEVLILQFTFLVVSGSWGRNQERLDFLLFSTVSLFILILCGQSALLNYSLTLLPCHHLESRRWRYTVNGFGQLCTEEGQGTEQWPQNYSLTREGVLRKEDMRKWFCNLDLHFLGEGDVVSLCQQVCMCLKCVYPHKALNWDAVKHLTLAAANNCSTFEKVVKYHEQWNPSHWSYHMY